jgi:hypothetical protein
MSLDYTRACDVIFVLNYVGSLNLFYRIKINWRLFNRLIFLWLSDKSSWLPTYFPR